MSDIAIKVENLSKRYRIGLKESQAETLAGALAGWLKAPFDNYRNLRKLSHFNPNGHNGHEPDDIIYALKDVSFEVKHGEAVGIIGRNGAGKSTLLKILSKITEPTSGRATLNGRVSSLLEVGTGFHPELTGRENIYLNGTILGMSKAEIDRKFDEMVDFSGVEKFIDTPVKRYSSGMKVRLAFAVAAHLEPEILLVDEVLAVGDASFQRKCLGKMGNIAEEGRTILFVSHSMKSIRQLCQTGLMIEAGQIQFDGKIEQAINLYFEENALQQNGTITVDMHKVSDGIKFTQVRIFDQENQQVTVPKNFRPILFQIDLELTRSIVSPMVITLGLDTIDGTSISRISSLENWSSKLRPGKNRLWLELELPISSGLYVLILRVDQTQPSSKRLAVVGNAMTFELQESRYLGFDAANKPYRNGLIPLEGKWSFESLTE
ncbi:MAG: ABC transporter ATP-binding protein [Anaerolineales bacterium]|nr:ABC transporter ATP-binding protein [Anaerolineales bacterium]